MAAQANIVINDGAGTPVAHTFNPKGASTNPVTRKNVAIWRDQSVGPALNYPSIQEEYAPSNVNLMQKVRFLIKVPTLEQAASGGSFVPPPSLAYANWVAIEYGIHDRSSDLELNHLYAYSKNLLALQYVKDVVTKRESSW